MEREQKIEEGLSIIWEEREKKVSDETTVRNRIYEKLKEDIFGDLVKEGYLTADGSLVRLTKPGEEKAKDIIRRQRLAERLLTDVLEIDRREMDSSACEF